jgi:hypothetical protein
MNHSEVIFNSVLCSEFGKACIRGHDVREIAKQGGIVASGMPCDVIRTPLPEEEGMKDTLRIERNAGEHTSP